MYSAPAVSVVVPTYNRAERLGPLLAGLRDQLPAGIPFELIVVDDCSTDSTPAVLAAELERGELPLRVVRRERNGGPGPARESGWRVAEAPIVAFTDDDCRPAPGWLVAGIAAGAEEAIVQGRTEPDPNALDRLGPFTRTIEVRAPDAAFQTCNVFYPRATLERVGGFDTAAFAHGGEDADLAWRAIDAGAEARFEPEALVFHEVAELGPRGKLRVALRWAPGMLAFVRHPELRRAHFHSRWVWKRTHLLLLVALIAPSLRGRLRPLGPLLVLPYARSLRARGKLEGGGLALAPFYFLYDLLETFTALRGSLRFRRPMI